MTAIGLQAPDPVVGRGLAAMLVIASCVVLAQSADHLDPTTALDERQKREIYESAGDWRAAEAAVEDEWRQAAKPEPAPKSRITFGYESLYDDPQIRRDQTTTTLDLEIEKYRPSSAFQIKF